MPPELEFNDVSKVFGQNSRKPFTAVEHINLQVEPGHFVCMIGPSGCGKSTLLNLAAGLMYPTSGQVLHRGRPITRVNTHVGYMTQQNNLLPWRTLEKNVGIALEIRGIGRAERKKRVEETLAMVGLDGFGGRYPSQLSGGMQKRAALARMLIYEPDTLLMDEPFGAVDAQLRMSLQTELYTLWERHRRTVLFVTHDLEEALLLGDRVVVFSGGPGTIIHVEDIDFPRPRSAADLRESPAFRRTWERLWKLLLPQMNGSVA